MANSIIKAAVCSSGNSQGSALRPGCFIYNPANILRKAVEGGPGVSHTHVGNLEAPGS